MDPDAIKKDLEEILELSSERVEEIQENEEIAETSRQHSKKDHEAEASDSVGRRGSATLVRRVSQHYVEAHGLVDEDNFSVYEALEHSEDLSLLAHRTDRPERDSDRDDVGNDQESFEENDSQLRADDSSKRNSENQDIPNSGNRDSVENHPSMPMKAKLKEALFGLAPASDLDDHSSNSDKTDEVPTQKTAMSFYDHYDKKVVLAPGVDPTSHPDFESWHTHRALEKPACDQTAEKEPSFYDEHDKMIEFEPSHGNLREHQNSSSNSQQIVNLLTVDNKTTLHPDGCKDRSSENAFVQKVAEHETAYSSYKNSSSQSSQAGEKNNAVNFKHIHQDFVAFSMLPQRFVSPTESQEHSMVFGIPPKPNVVKRETPKTATNQSPNIVSEPKVDKTQDSSHGYIDCQMDVFCEKPVSTSQRDLRLWHETERKPETDVELDEYVDDSWHGRTHYAPETSEHKKETEPDYHADENSPADLAARRVTIKELHVVPVRNPVEIKESDTNVKTFLDRKLRQSISGHPYKALESNTITEKETNPKNVERKADHSVATDIKQDRQAGHGYIDCQMDVFFEKPVSTSQRDLRLWHDTERRPETDGELDEYLDDSWHGKPHYTNVKNPVEIANSDVNVKSFVDRKLRQSISGHPYDIDPSKSILTENKATPQAGETKKNVDQQVTTDDDKSHDQQVGHTFADCQMDVFCEKPVSTSQRDLRVWHETERKPETDGELDEYVDDSWHGRTHYVPEFKKHEKEPNYLENEKSPSDLASRRDTIKELHVVPVRNPVEIKESDTNVKSFLDRKLRQSMSGHPYEIDASNSIEPTANKRGSDSVESQIHQTESDPKSPQNWIDDQEGRAPATVSYVQQKIFEERPEHRVEDLNLPANPKLKDDVHYSPSTEMMVHEPHHTTNDSDTKDLSANSKEGEKRICKCALKRAMRAAQNQMISRDVEPISNQRNHGEFHHQGGLRSPHASPFTPHMTHHEREHHLNNMRPMHPMTALSAMAERFHMDKEPIHHRMMPGQYHHDDDGYRNVARNHPMEKIDRVDSSAWMHENASFDVDPSYHHRVPLGARAPPVFRNPQVEESFEAFGGAEMKKEGKLRKCRCFLKRMSKALRKNRDDEK